MQKYLELGERILLNGVAKGSRTEENTTSIFGHEMRFDLSDNKLAAVTTKKLHLKSIIHELLWMISGSTNIRYLQNNGVRIWDEWADDKGDLGPIYGAQWRKIKSIKRHGMGFKSTEIDQLATLIKTLQTDPDSRRMIVDSWNVSRLSEMKLVPCHLLFQCYSEVDASGQRLLSMQVYQRSVDYFLGLPFNLFFYSLLTHMIAAQTGHVAKELIHIGGDCHIYDNHQNQITKQLKRQPKKCTPHVVLNPEITSIDDYRFGDIEIVDYHSHPLIAGKVSV